MLTTSAAPPQPLPPGTFALAWAALPPADGVVAFLSDLRVSAGVGRSPPGPTRRRFVVWTAVPGTDLVTHRPGVQAVCLAAAGQDPATVAVGLWFAQRLANSPGDRTVPVTSPRIPDITRRLPVRIW